MFSGVRLFATPWTVAYQASPSMRFSRQGYWSGLPFPSPLVVIINIASMCLVAQSCWTLCSPMDCKPQAPLPTEFSRREYWSQLPIPPPGNLSEPGMEPESLVSPALASGLFTTSTTWEAQTQHSIHFTNLPWCCLLPPLECQLHSYRDFFLLCVQFCIPLPRSPSAWQAVAHLVLVE